MLPALISAGLLVAGCAPLETGSQGRQALTVFAAASLADAFAVLEGIFEAEHPGIDVIHNLAGSQALARQLAEGAPADVFASANMRQMSAAIDSGRIEADAPQIFAGNRLVIVLPGDNPAGVTTLEELAQPGVKIVLAAAEVPAGEYALAALKAASATPDFGPGFGDAVLANVASYEENVRSVLNKVVLGEADAGIVYASDVASVEPGRVVRVEIPIEFNPPVRYPVAVVADSRLPAEAAAYIALLLSSAGEAVLAEAGLTPASQLP